MKAILRMETDVVGRPAGVMPEHNEQAEEEKPLWWTIVQVCQFDWALASCRWVLQAFFQL